MQAEQGVVIAPFEVAVDTLMSLRINATDIANLFSTVSNASTTDVISAIVFRCHISGSRACSAAGAGRLNAMHVTTHHLDMDSTHWDRHCHQRAVQHYAGAGVHHLVKQACLLCSTILTACASKPWLPVRAHVYEDSGCTIHSV